MEALELFEENHKLTVAEIVELGKKRNFDWKTQVEPTLQDMAGDLGMLRFKENLPDKCKSTFQLKNEGTDAIKNALEIAEKRGMIKSLPFKLWQIKAGLVIIAIDLIFRLKDISIAVKQLKEQLR